jgi:hypothetical protein
MFSDPDNRPTRLALAADKMLAELVPRLGPYFRYVIIEGRRRSA